MKVNILFSGLCLFVPKRGADPLRGMMHVLLPHHHHGGAADRHAAALRFDSAHLRAASPSPSLIFAQVLLRDRAFQIANGNAELKLCAQIVDLRPVTGTSIDPLSSTTTDRIDSRVTLGSGKMTAVSPGHCWKWDPEGTRPLAHQALWTMDVTDGSLTLLLQHLRKAEETEVTLHPIDGVINLEVHHVPHGDLPLDPPVHQAPPPETQPPHFRAFYDVFGPSTPVLLPRYKGPLVDCGSLQDPCPVIPELGGSPFTCMMAGVTE